MPKREDEYWAAQKESRGAPLCPRCGSTKVYYNRHYRSWRCGRCEYSFPTPSYGAGHVHQHRSKPINSALGKLRSRRQSRWSQSLILLLLTASAIGIIAYTYYHIPELARPVVIGIMTAAGIVALWDIITFSDVRKYKVRRYGTIFVSLILVALIGCSVAAYAKVSPLYEAKNAVVEWFHKGGNSQGEQSSSANPIPSSTGTRATAPAPSQTRAGINSRTGIYKNYYLGLVDTPEGTLSGNGCYDDSGHFIVLINNKDAVNPTYAQMVSFLQQDRTDQFPYTYSLSVPGSYYGSAESYVDLTRIQGIIDGTEQPSPPQVCADFAERLHNDAEMAGIRCAYVSIDLSGYTGGHALDAFQTTDMGLVYVDDTNSPGPTRCVKTVNVQVGQQYIPHSLFPEVGWDSTWDSLGTVTNVYTTWDGNWNN